MWAGAVWVVESGVRMPRQASITFRAQCLRASGNRDQAQCAFLEFEVIYGSREILQNLVNNLIDAAQSWHAHRHEAKQP